MWKSQADVAEELEGNRKANNSVGLAIERNDKEDTTKRQVKGWYLFRDKQIALGDWKPCIPRCRSMSREEKSRMGKISAEKRKVPIKGCLLYTSPSPRD